MHNFTIINAVDADRHVTLLAANQVTGPTMTNDTAQCTLDTEEAPINGANRATAEASLEFGRFRLLLRQRLLLRDGVPIELGTRAFELLLALLEANGSLISKKQLLARVWPGIVVAEENLKAQIFALRRALGEDRDLIRTEVGRGYRVTATVRSTVAGGAFKCPMGRLYRSTQRLFPQPMARRPSHGWSVQALFVGHFDPARGEEKCFRPHPLRRR